MAYQQLSEVIVILKPQNVSDFWKHDSMFILLLSLQQINGQVQTIAVFTTEVDLLLQKWNIFSLMVCTTLAREG